MRFSSSSRAFPLFSAGFVLAARVLSSSPWCCCVAAAFTRSSSPSPPPSPSPGSSHESKRRRSDDALSNRGRSLFADHRAIERLRRRPLLPLPPLSTLFSFSSDSGGGGVEPTPASNRRHRDEILLRSIDEPTIRRIQDLVERRSEARSRGDYELADDLKDRIVGFPGVPDGHKIVVRDIPRSSGGGSEWNLVHTKEIYDEEMPSSSPSILRLAHAAMGLAVECNERAWTAERERERRRSLESIVDDAKVRLRVLLDETRRMDEINSVFEVSTKNTMVQTELGGRTASDAALWFAFAGCRDRDLFDGLADVASWELRRFGNRPSFRDKHALQIVERFAAAGLMRHDELERSVARALLAKKNDDDDDDGTLPTKSDGGESRLNLHSERSLLLIWKFATKQKKQGAFLSSVRKNWEEYHGGERDRSASKEIAAGPGDGENDATQSIPASSCDWSDLFRDPSRPLVVDVGCGMGVSLLGLATTGDADTRGEESARLLLDDENLRWSGCNFVGVDLGSLGIEYARGVAHRWNLDTDNVHFAVDAAEDFCRRIESYPGEIRCCMIQFPTPFRLQHKDSGNSQLPASQLDGFMVTESLLTTIRSSLHPTKGRLLLQSNCEDVAVWMRNLACNEVGFTTVDVDEERVATPSASSVSASQRTPQRTLEWIAEGGERAEGRGWIRRNVLHKKGATETEVSCEINGTPVHRCVLRANPPAV